MGLWNSLVDYNICDRKVEWPSEYGLQWRPIYEGFTDKNYFKMTEQDIDSIDSSGKLSHLLSTEPHSIGHSFAILKNKGWKVGKTDGAQFFVNPTFEKGYVQVQHGGGLEPYYTRVHEIDELFEIINLKNLKEIHFMGDERNREFVAITATPDSTYFYLSYDPYEIEGEGFVCVRDSILSLPNWREIRPFEDDSDGNWFHVKPDYYDAYETLNFLVIQFEKSTLRIYLVLLVL